MADITLSMEDHIGHAGARPVNLRCPTCRHMGSFQGLNDVRDATWSQVLENENGVKLSHSFSGGIRKCPNWDCHAPVFVVLRSGELHASFPPEVIDFDPKNVPPGIQGTLEEAIKCHAGSCYKASAIMVRRVLEELCANQGAEGKTLYDKLEALKAKVVMPQELLEATHELRILGNDAAHIEAKEYDQVGKDEAEAGIELAKELLKAVYQLDGLVDRLRRLKKSETQPSA